MQKTCKTLSYYFNPVFIENLHFIYIINKYTLHFNFSEIVLRTIFEKSGNLQGSPLYPKFKLQLLRIIT